MDYSSQNLKDQFLLDPGVVFLNHGSFGATPKPVFESYQRWQLQLERQPVEFLGRRATALLADARQSLAELLGTQRDNLVFVTNVTVGLNIVARSLNLGPGDEVLTSDMEYGALDRTWRFLSKKQGFKYINQSISVPVRSAEQFIADLWSGVTPRTRVLFLSHITSPTALITPVAALCERARAQGILTVIDGAHTAGQIDLDLEGLGADFYSGNLHKWLCAPKGAGFLYARPACQPIVEPLVVSWGYESETPGPSRFVDYLEWMGTRDLAPFLAVPDAIRFQAEHAWPQVRAACHTLASRCLSRITDLTGLPLLYPDVHSMFAQMAVAALPAWVDTVLLKTRLYDEYHVEVPLVEWNGSKFVRFSFQGYNNEADLESLVNALAHLLVSTGGGHA